MDEYLIDMIYGAVIAPETWKDVVRGICGAFDAHSGVLAFSDNETVLSTISVAHGVFEDRAIVGSYFSHYAAIDGAVPVYAALPVGELLAMSKTWSRRRLARDEFYNDFFIKIGLADSVGGTLIRDPRGTAIFSMQRDNSAGDFAKGDLAAMRSLLPHLRRALQMHRAIGPSLRAAVAFVDGLDYLQVGVITIDEDGRVWHRNKSAKDILDRRDGLALSGTSGLSADDRTADARLAKLVGEVLAGEGHAGGQVRVTRTTGKPPYAVLVAPLPAYPLSIFDVAGRRGALILINDPDRAQGNDLATAMARYRLTPAEMRLLGALVAGQSLHEYCEERSISINTGKFHLRALFAKTEARGQVDLVRIALMAMSGV